VLLGTAAKPGLRAGPVSRTLDVMETPEPPVELWVDDHQEYEPGVVHAHLRHARVPIDPRPDDYLVVGDDDAPPLLAEVLNRSADGTLRLRLLPGRPDSHPEFRTRRHPTAV
jgi:hypothetical protein